MIRMNKLVLAAVAAAFLFSNAGQAKASFFQVTNVTFTPGSGIGLEPISETGPGGGKFLGIDSAVVASTPVDFSLSTVGDNYTFDAATYQFNAAETFITPNEGNPLHDLGFTLGLTFSTPDFGGPLSLAIDGTAILGRVRDTANNGNVPELDDYILSFVPVVQNFAGGGSVLITVTSIGQQAGFLGLANNADQLTLQVTVELLNAVPEPTSMTLLGLGGIGALVVGYRRRRAAKVAA